MATNIFVRNKEKLDYFVAQKGESLNFYLKDDSFLRCFVINLGGESLKNELSIIFNGRRGRAELYGLYLPSDNKVIENYTLLHHRAPACQSFQQYYGILAGSGRAVFNGRILVEKQAQKTDAFLESKNVLLGQEAQMLGRPFLEIFADDVKCTHAFSSSQVEKDELFYLRSRGIGEKEAKRILLLGFAQRIINNINSRNLRKDLCARTSQFLNEKLGAKN